MLTDAIITDQLVALLATIVAAIGCYITYVVLPDRMVGPSADYWNTFRRAVYPRLHDRLQKLPGNLYASYEISQEEFVGTLEKPLDDVEKNLSELGLRRTPFLAALKWRMRDGERQYEAGSWVHRKRPLASHQTHVMLFETKDGVDVYAHYEYSPVHPLYAYEHFRGDGADIQTGVNQVEEWLF